MKIIQFLSLPLCLFWIVATATAQSYQVITRGDGKRCIFGHLTGPETATACSDHGLGCCVGDQACRWDPYTPEVTMCEEACVGRVACNFQGFRSDKVTVGVASCRGEQSCDQMYVPVGDGSCVGEYACAHAFEVGVDSVGDNSCHGVIACLRRMGSVGNNSCHNKGSRGNGSAEEASCAELPNSGAPRSTVGHNSCHGHNACKYAGDIGNGSCLGLHNKCDYAISVGDCVDECDYQNLCLDNPSMFFHPSDGQCKDFTAPPTDAPTSEPTTRPTEAPTQTPTVAPTKPYRVEDGCIVSESLTGLQTKQACADEGLECCNKHPYSCQWNARPVRICRNSCQDYLSCGCPEYFGSTGGCDTFLASTTRIDIDEGSCNAPSNYQACIGATKVGKGSCLLGGACFGATAEIGDNSCLGGPNSCYGAQGTIGDNSCTAQSACRGVNGVIGVASCSEESACSSATSIGDGSCHEVVPWHEGYACGQTVSVGDCVGSCPKHESCEDNQEIIFNSGTKSCEPCSNQFVGSVNTYIITVRGSRGGLSIDVIKNAFRFAFDALPPSSCPAFIDSIRASYPQFVDRRRLQENNTATVETFQLTIEVSAQGLPSAPVIDLTVPANQDTFIQNFNDATDGALTASTMEDVTPRNDDTFSGGAVDDPHFKTWNGTWFDFMGACDLRLVTAPFFAPGLPLTIDIRTTIRRSYSFIESAVVKIGDHRLEVGSWGQYFLNGVEGALRTDRVVPELSGFPISYAQVNKKVHKFAIDLGGGETIRIKTFKDMVSIMVDNVEVTRFHESQGMMGEFGTGLMVGRDGQTVLEDPDSFAAEWQIRDTEETIFQSVRAPQYPEACRMPEPASTSRRLGSRSAAEQACADWPEDTREGCILDVLATGDLDLAAAGAL